VRDAGRGYFRKTQRRCVDPEIPAPRREIIQARLNKPGIN
jgi:hypothetical protein